jgi:hypothetical protein
MWKVPSPSSVWTAVSTPFTVPKFVVVFGNPIHSLSPEKLVDTPPERGVVKG